jgi:hypothetical protein
MMHLQKVKKYRLFTRKVIQNLLVFRVNARIFIPRGREIVTLRTNATLYAAGKVNKQRRPFQTAAPCSVGGGIMPPRRLN